MKILQNDSALSEILIPLGKEREGVLVATLPRHSIELSEDEMMKDAYELFMDDFFHTKDEDFSEAMFQLMHWHFNYNDFSSIFLTENDRHKCLSIDSFSFLNSKGIEKSHDALVLSLDKISKEIAFLVCPMVVKTPIRTIKYRIEIDTWFTFSKIRKSKHEYADEIIDYLYEVMILHQKLSRQFRIMIKTVRELHKDSSLLSENKINFIFLVEYTSVFLKAIIEKIIAVVAYSYEIKNIVEGKTHKSKMNALERGIPEKIKKQFYFAYFMDIISSSSIEQLNNIRTGILHKRGTSHTQLHNYFEVDIDTIEKSYDILWEYNEKVSAATILMLSMLTDKLVELDSPSLRIEQLPCSLFEKYLKG